jgi:hypothetical protein
MLKNILQGRRDKRVSEQEGNNEALDQLRKEDIIVKTDARNKQ